MAQKLDRSNLSLLQKKLLIKRAMEGAFLDFLYFARYRWQGWLVAAFLGAALSAPPLIAFMADQIEQNFVCTPKG